MKKKTEAKKQIILKHLLQSSYNPLTTSAALELKVPRHGRISFRQLEDHQETALLSSKHRSLYHKVSDMSLEQKPFDTVFFKGSEAYVVVFWDACCFCFIDIDKWIESRAEHIMKSLTHEECHEVSRYIVKMPNSGGDQ